MHLTSAMIFVRDMPLMKAFYRDILGLIPSNETPDATWVEFTTGGATLTLHAIPPHIAQNIVIGNPPQPRSDTPIKLTFAVNDLKAEQIRLTALGVTLLPRPWRTCDGIDPEGNIFQLCQQNET